MKTGLRFALLGLAVAGAAVGCHLALGIEDAETIAEGTGGNATGCTTDGQCDDTNPCTEDSCSGGRCQNTPVADGDAPAAQQIEGDCKRLVCTSGVSESTNDDSDLPVDGEDCTEDLCSDGTPSNPALPGGTACTQSNNSPGFCNDAASCRGCFSNQNCELPGETCGGGGTPWVCGCTPTTTCSSLGKTCGSWGNDECNHIITCNNGFQDGSETDIDCGGQVPIGTATCNIGCAAGKMCSVNTDCATSCCDGGTCIVPNPTCP